VSNHLIGQRGPAIELLTQLFQSMPAAWIEKGRLNLVVVGAGQFPSFSSLVFVLKQKLPYLEYLDITLIEPVQFRTAIFQQQFSNLQKNHLIPLKINIKIYHGLLNEFLEGLAPPQKFDVLYLEHADFRTLPVLFSQMIGIGWRALLLRYALPYLTKIMVPDAFIIASCLSQRELFFLKSLLQFSFNVQPQLIKLAGIHHYWYGGPYQSGLAVSIKPTINQRLQKMRANWIRTNDNHFGWILFISCFLLWIKINSIYVLQELAVAVLTVLLQFFFHGTGPLNRPIQLLLLLGLLVI